MTGVAEKLNDELGRVAAGARQALVQVASGRIGAGSGVLVHDDGMVLTAAHVLHGRRTAVRLMDGREVEASVLAISRALDLAALSIEVHNAPALELSDTSTLRAGEWVYALGHPWGVRGGTTAGVVIGVGNDLPEAPYSPVRSEWLATSLHLRPGHSGGPLIDSRGRLIGINTRMSGPDVGLAVPPNVIRAFLRRKLGRRQAA